MNNLTPLWTLVDQFRNAADALEHEIKVSVGDAPEHLDLARDYSVIVQALADAAAALTEIANRDGLTVTRAHAAKARVISGRCTRALDELLSTGARK